MLTLSKIIKISQSFFRKRIGVITKKIPRLHFLLVFFYHIVILEIWPRLSGCHTSPKCVGTEDQVFSAFLSLQTPSHLTLSLPSPTDDNEFITQLRSAGIPFSRGGWTLYLPPSQALFEKMPQLKQYPSNSGVKILRYFAPPEQASYTPHKLHPVPGAAATRARTPSPQVILRIAGYLATEGLTPVVHDLVELTIGEVRATAYIVEHVESIQKPQKEEYRDFCHRLDDVLARDVVRPAHGDYRLSSDFSEPDCHGNLICPQIGRALYIDHQSFVFNDEKAAYQIWAQKYADKMLFGPRRLLKSENYLYQMIPGLGDAKRGTLDRYEVISALLKEAGVDLYDRYTFDIGCNSGLMSYFALSKGARWAFGWDRPDVAEASQTLLRLLGASRWLAFGENIKNTTDFCKHLPYFIDQSQDSVLFYFAISNHIGFPQTIKNLPWKYCIYEGHSNQSVDESIKKINDSGWGDTFSILATNTIQDGDSPQRSLVIFSRER